MLIQSMKHRQSPFRRIFTVILFCIVFILIYFAAVLIGGVFPVRGQSSSGAEVSVSQKVLIYLDNNGRHYDIWLPAQYCGFLASSDNSVSGGWYAFGWGDRDFFLNTPFAGDVDPGLLLKALFWPSRSVLAVQYSERPPSNRSSVTAVEAAAENVTVAADYIYGWFLQGFEGLVPVPANLVHPSYTGYSFYESRGHYSLFFTSNNWVNRVLKKAGLSTGLWTPLTFGIGRGTFLPD